MPRPSDQSYQDFVQMAFNYFVGLINPAKPNAGGSARALYSLYSRYHPDRLIGPKVPLAGVPLYTALVGFIDNVGGRIVRVQNDDWNILDKPAVRAEYQELLDRGHALLTRAAKKTITSYLHVYPTGTTRADPETNKLKRAKNRRGNNNWRIGINVEPNSMAAAVARLMTIMDNNADIDHIKFSAPGTAGKPDSVIVYLRKKNTTYLGIRGAVQGAVGGLNIQHKFSPMWSEFADGFAEAAEPPKGGGSFGRFRCYLAVLAYYYLLDRGEELTVNHYLAWTSAIFEIFGIPRFSQHEQGPLNDPLYDNQMRLEFMQVLALKEGRAANYYKNRQLTDR